MFIDKYLHIYVYPLLGGENEEELPAWLLPQSPMDKIFRQSFGNVGQQDLEDLENEFQGDVQGDEVISPQKRDPRSPIVDDEGDREGEERERGEISQNVSSELFPSSSPVGRTGPRPRSAKGRLRTTGRAAGDLFPNSNDRTELSNFLLDRGSRDDNADVKGDGNGGDGERSMSSSRYIYIYIYMYIYICMC
jgi:hypothetical protein